MFILAEVKQDTAEKGWISQSQWNHGVKHLPQHLVQNCNKPSENNNELLLYSASNNLKKLEEKTIIYDKIHSNIMVGTHSMQWSNKDS